MSAIGGIFHLDGRPCDREGLQRLADGLRHRATDGTFTGADGPVGLIHGRMVTTPESADEPQPFVDSSGGLAITFDGRLDNREELIDALDATDAPATTAGDAQLILRAYSTFGEACVDHLLGDFAFAVWDRPQRRVFCARDVMGIKPFFYRTTSDTIAWASEVGVLASCAGPLPAPNEGMVGEYLSGMITDPSETLYRNVYRLPAAHLLTADAHGVSVRRYWQPNLQQELRFERGEEYVERLTDLVRRAVRARLRVRGSVGIMLSGGVDSSSVTGVAHEFLAQGDAPCDGVETFSLVVPGQFDESRFIEQVVDRWKLPAHRFVGEPSPAGQFRDEAARYLDVPTSPSSAVGDELRAGVRGRRMRVLLTGLGSDEWLGTKPGAYADLLKQGDVRGLIRRVRHEAARDDFVGWGATAKAALWPLFPGAARRVIKRALRRGRPPAWVNPAFAARIGLVDRLAGYGPEMPFQSFEQRDIWRDATGGASTLALEMLDREGARFGFEYRHPFFDRRIVEFALALPAEERWRDGRAKSLLRRAMAPYLPEAVSNRLSSPSGSAIIAEAIEIESGPAPFADLITERLGWVRGAKLGHLFQQMKQLSQGGDPRSLSLAELLWPVLAVELWARAVSGFQPADEGASRRAL